MPHDSKCSLTPDKKTDIVHRKNVKENNINHIRNEMFYLLIKTNRK